MSARLWAGLLLAVACAGTDAPAPPTDAPDTAIDPPDLPVVAQVTPEVAWGDTPLVCDATGADRVVWLRQGLAWDGAVSTTPPDGPLVGNTIAAADQRPGDVWTCIAIGPRDQVVVSRPIRPANVLLIVIDDLGWGDLSSYGGELATPRVDALAAQGVRFTQAYAASPMCGPSRAGLLTGRQPSRYGFEYNVEDNATLEDRGLDTRERTLADALLAQGYDTALIGKWHLGAGPAFHPNVRGFQKFWGFLNGRRLSVAPGLPGVVEYQVAPEEVEGWPYALGGYGVEEDGVPVTLDDRHLTDRIADEAVAWLRGHADRPFLLDVAFQAVHLPLQATPAQLAAVPEQADLPRWAYHASVAAMDAAVGRILDALDETGLADHTLVAFVSDNGCPEPGITCSNGDLAGGKLQLTEGGIRVPMIVRWPQHLSRPQVSDEVVSLMDVFPTALHAAGAPTPTTPLDGVDLVPLMEERAPGPLHPSLYWRVLPDRAVRTGDVKVVDRPNYRWRFDLAADRGETANLNAADPDGSLPYVDALDRRGDEAYSPPAWLGRPYTISYYGTDVVSFY